MIFHCQVKSFSRASGESAVGAAAYRAAEKIRDDRTGEVHDYRGKRGVKHREIIVPEGEPAIDRRQLSNMMEAAEKRKDAKVAREVEIALPAGLTDAERVTLAQDFAREIVKRYGVAVDVCVHKPGKGGDIRNHHAHLLTTTRKYEGGALTVKTRELDSPKTSPAEVEWIRATWERRCNDALERSGIKTAIGDENRRAKTISAIEKELRFEEKMERGVEDAKARHAAKVEREAEQEAQAEREAQAKRAAQLARKAQAEREALRRKEAEEAAKRQKLKQEQGRSGGMGR